MDRTVDPSEEQAVALVEPTEQLEAAYWDYAADFAAAGETELPGGEMRAGEDFAAFLRRLRNESQGIGLQAGWVPATTLWLVAGGRVIGQCSIRHRLTESLRDFGGHIGYSIRPSERRKGHGTLMLGLALDHAKALGIARVLITCDYDNVGSARVIESNGGVLESESFSPGSGRVTRRYWIDLTAPERG